MTMNYHALTCVYDAGFCLLCDVVSYFAFTVAFNITERQMKVVVIVNVNALVIIILKVVFLRISIDHIKISCRHCINFK